LTPDFHGGKLCALRSIFREPRFRILKDMVASKPGMRRLRAAIATLRQNTLSFWQSIRRNMLLLMGLSSGSRSLRLRAAEAVAHPHNLRALGERNRFAIRASLFQRRIFL
jgi:hypothetical protein